MARVKILRAWKGPLEAGQVVQTCASDSVTFYGDGFVPTAGATLIIYADSGEPYFLNACSWTRDMAGAEREVRALDRLAKRRNRRGE